MKRILIAVAIFIIVFDADQNTSMKRRIFIEKTTVIYAQPNDIFGVLMDLEGWHQWTPSITRMSILDNDQPAPGVKIKILQPKLPPSIWTITEVNKDRALVWEKRSFGLRMLSEHFISEGAAGTRVTIRITYEGPLAGLAWWLSRKLTDRYMTMEINGLKATFTNDIDADFSNKTA
jgi:Polyketide cyclase / dehydrase and lipid transport